MTANRYGDKVSSGGGGELPRAYGDRPLGATAL
jgi:hypothetical protein